MEITRYLSSCAKNILVVNYGNVGDIVCNLFLIQSLTKHFEDKKVSLIVSKKNFPVVMYDTSFWKCFVWEEPNGFSFNDEKSLKEEMVDTIIFLRGTTKGVYLKIHTYLKQVFPKAKFVGMIKDSSEGNFDYFWCHNDYGSIHERLYNFGKFLLGEKDFVKPKIFVPQDVIENVKNKLLEVFDNKFPLIYINLSAGEKNDFVNYLKRNITIKQYVKIISELIKKYKINILLTAAKQDYHKGDIICTKLNYPKNIYFFKGLNIFQLFAVIKFSDMVISPETSVIHISSVLNKPIIGLYSSKKRLTEWPPLSDKYVVILPRITRWMFTLSICDLLKIVEKKIMEWKILEKV
jgi:ADP-heptose:LPS heptosyltransferase